MNHLLCFAALLALTASLCAQPSTSPPPAAQAKPAPAAAESQATKANPSASTSSSPRDDFSQRLNKILGGHPAGNPVAELPLTNNYRLKVDYLTRGKLTSFSILTAHPVFSYQGFGKENVLTNGPDATLVVPSTISFEGQLSKESETSIFLGYFLGQSVPYPTMSKYSGGASGSYSSIQQMQTGMKGGAIFTFGKPLKLVESGGQEITVTIDRVKEE